MKATRDFTDAGTGRSFRKGEAVDVEKGELENYRAAGLVAGADPKPNAKGEPKA